VWTGKVKAERKGRERWLEDGQKRACFLRSQTKRRGGNQVKRSLLQHKLSRKFKRTLSGEVWEKTAGWF